MSGFVYRCLAFLLRALLSLRYRVEVKGFEKIRKQSKGMKKVLLLPNHTSHVDPFLLYAYLGPDFKMSPLIMESVWFLPYVRNVVPFLKPILIPDFRYAISPFKVKRSEGSVVRTIERLKTGGNILLFPSGKLKGQGREMIGGASALHEIILNVPDAHFLLIRITGLWGSRFSKAWTGRSPQMVSTFVQAAKELCLNFIFFSPRRKVTIEFGLDPADFPKQDTKLALNRFLEDWYGAEPLSLVSSRFWSRNVHRPFSNEKKEERSSHSDDLSTKQKVFDELRLILKSPALPIKEEMSLSNDLGMDSLNMAELLSFLILHYNVEALAPEDLDTVQSILDVIQKPRVKTEKMEAVCLWPEERDRPAPSAPVGETLPEAFLNLAQIMKNLSAMGDDSSGVLSYQKAKRSILVLARHFQTFPEEKIGVLLPSSSGALIVILALHFAGKIPVMLNWTLGRLYVEKMMEISGAKRILTSWKFTHRAPNLDLGVWNEKVEFLEDIRFFLPISYKIKGALLSYFSPRLILKQYQIDSLRGEEIAVILFSSGTEGSPKGIPLSHTNLLASISDSIWNYKEVLSPNDVVLGTLPCFHAFGLNVSGFLALVSGLRAAFYPNPTDILGVAESIKKWKITYFPTVPTILRKLLALEEGRVLRGVRFIMTAGEKTSPDLFEKMAQTNPDCQLTEGYGLTETSPTISIMRPFISPKGVGQLLPHVKGIAIHLETLEPLSEGSQGEICVKGANVFSGYLGNVADPFVLIKGEKWFRTGDIGSIESDQTVILQGRVKRFVKLGGEMISLAAIEEALRSECLKKKMGTLDLPFLALSSLQDSNGVSELILFVTFDIQKETMNQMLRELGFSNLIKVSSIYRVAEIPLMGLGKINYQSLHKALSPK